MPEVPRVSEGEVAHGAGETSVTTRSGSNSTIAHQALLAPLYERHAASMKRLAYLMTGSNAIAEDVVHDTFLRCVDRLTDVRDAGQYLRAAVVNACRDDWRRRRRLAPLPPERSEEPPASADALAVRAALAQMNPRERAAVVLRFYGDFSHDQIAAVLDCQPATSRSLVARGLKHLKEVLS